MLFQSKRHKIPIFSHTKNRKTVQQKRKAVKTQGGIRYENKYLTLSTSFANFIDSCYTKCFVGYVCVDSNAETTSVRKQTASLYTFSAHTRSYQLHTCGIQLRNRQHTFQCKYSCPRDHANADHAMLNVSLLYYCLKPILRSSEP